MSAIPGPYSIAISSFEDSDSDALTLRTISYGYDSADEAHAALPGIAKEEKVDLNDLCVYQIIEK